MYLGVLNPKMAKKKFGKIGNNWLGGAKKSILAPKTMFFQYFLKCVSLPNNQCFFHQHTQI